MFLALRELSFARGRFALIGSVISLVGVLTVLLSGLANGLVDDGISGLRALPVSHLGFQQGADSTFSRSTVGTNEVAALGAVPGATAEPFGLTLVNATNEDDANFDLALMGLADDGFVAEEMLGLRLVSIHNVHFLVRLGRESRARILAGDFDSWSRTWLRRYHGKDS